MIDKINEYLEEKRFKYDDLIVRLIDCKTDQEKLSVANEIIAQKKEAEKIFYDLYEIINQKRSDK